MNPTTTLTNNNPPATHRCGLNPSPICREESDTPHNICEHCPNFRTDSATVAVLAAQRVDTAALADDAEARGWIDEAERHRKLLARLDTLIAAAG